MIFCDCFGFHVLTLAYYVQCRIDCGENGLIVFLLNVDGLYSAKLRST